MDKVWPFLAVAGGFAAVLGALTWLAARVRRRGIGGAAMAPIDEIFRPTAHQSHHEIHAQSELRASLPSADAPDTQR